MRTLVTGSSGFIGMQLVRDLASHGSEVIAVDHAPPADAVAGVTHFQTDILDRRAVIAVMQESRPESVIHLAARTDLNEKRELSAYATNIEGVANLVEAIRATPGVNRAIYTSSQLVCRVGYIPKRADDYCPNTLYGQSKVLGEKIVRREDGGGVSWCIVRPTTVWGPGMSGHYQRLFRMIANGRYVHVGQRPLYKSFSYVGNLIYQYRMLLGARSSSLAGQTLYLADYEPVSLRAWTNAIQSQLGARPIRTVPEIVGHVAAAVGDILNRLGWGRFPYNTFRLRNILTEYVFDLNPALAICGPLPYSTEEGIAMTIAWLRSSGVLSARTATSKTAAESL